MRKSFVTLFSAMALTVLAVTFAAAAEKPNTVKNLQEAYNDEANAHERYLAFAKQADDEGYGEVASLFRAAARSEEIHMNNHGEVLRIMGAPAKSELKTPKVGTTKENIKEAMKDEAEERDVTYRDFMNLAAEEHNAEAERTFKYAKNAEMQHYTLLKDALANLEHRKGKSKKYYVCTVCGFVTDHLPNDKECDYCSEHNEKWDTVS